LFINFRRHLTALKTAVLKTANKTPLCLFYFVTEMDDFWRLQGIQFHKIQRKKWSNLYK